LDIHIYICMYIIIYERLLETPLRRFAGTRKRFFSKAIACACCVYRRSCEEYMYNVRISTDVVFERCSDGIRYPNSHQHCFRIFVTVRFVVHLTVLLSVFSISIRPYVVTATPPRSTFNPFVFVINAVCPVHRTSVFKTRTWPGRHPDGADRVYRLFIMKFIAHAVVVRTENQTRHPPNTVDEQQECFSVSALRPVMLPTLLAFSYVFRVDCEIIIITVRADRIRLTVYDRESLWINSGKTNPPPVRLGPT